MADEIRIIIAGMVLLAASGKIVINGDMSKLGAAIAVQGAKGRVGSYDVDIPEHETILSVDNVASVTGDTTPTRFKTDGLHLKGERVQLGVLNGSDCAAITSGATKENSLMSLPHIDEFLKSASVLNDKTRPKTLTDFTNLKDGPVRAWLDLPSTATVGTRHSEQRSEEAVEFRPSERLAMMSQQVEAKLARDNVNCVVVTSFANPANTLVYKLKSTGDVRIDFKNVMVEDSGEMVPGIGYDFELIYDLIVAKDPIPPLPYSLSAAASSSATRHVPGTELNAVRGVNCGPSTAP
jgi:hypothetical protein